LNLAFNDQGSGVGIHQGTNLILKLVSHANHGDTVTVT